MKVYWPWNNLGCLGVRLTRNVYFDFYPRNNFGFGGVWNLPGIYINYHGKRMWITPKGIRKDK